VDPATEPDTTDAALPGPLAVGDRVGPYEVLDLLGLGGTAAVYRARHRARGSLHALKLLIVDRPSLRVRLEAEVRAQTALSHPNLVAATDLVHCDDGAPAAVFEYVRGPSLADLLARSPLPTSDLHRVVRGLLEGVAHAHAHRVVHRDLKPANVLLAVHAGHLVPKVTDFGLVKLSADASGIRTRFGTAMGTPSYMPPEQFADASTVDARADVWALGVLMYEACTGRLPFEATDDASLVAQIAAARYVPPERLAPALPDVMARTIRAALRPLEDRPADAGALLALWGHVRPDAPWDPVTLSAAAALQPAGTPGATAATTFRRIAAPPACPRRLPAAVALGAALGMPAVAAAVAAGVALLHALALP
jgi:serine/threonine protein kinase